MDQVWHIQSASLATAGTLHIGTMQTCMSWIDREMMKQVKTVIAQLADYHPELYRSDRYVEA
jgi:hypothetical protein